MFATQVLLSHNYNQTQLTHLQTKEIWLKLCSTLHVYSILYLYSFSFAESYQGSGYQLFTRSSIYMHSSKQDSWIYDKLVPKYCDSFLYLFLVTGNLPSNTGVGKRYIPLLQFFLNGPIRIVYFNLFFFTSLKSFQILSAL